jgi:hemerythrin-like domain-containing protein
MNAFFAKPTPGFDTPLELLAACHERIQSQCATLQKLAQHLREHGADEQARQAAANIRRYFDAAGKHHHEDEEHDLFPILRRIAERSNAVELRSLLDTLIAEHRLMEQQWSALKPMLLAVENGQAVTLNAAQVAQFTALYASHIEREEQGVFTKASELLSQPQLERLGQTMAARRSS